MYNRTFIHAGFFALWVAASLYAVYCFMTSSYHMPSWAFPAVSFSWYALLILPLTILLAYLALRKQALSSLQRARILVALAGVLLITSFTMIQWTAATTSYGNIESFTAGNGAKHLMLSDSELASMSLFERKTLLRETAVGLYDHTFKQIWTFGGVVLASVFLTIALLKRSL